MQLKQGSENFQGRKIIRRNQMKYIQHSKRYLAKSFEQTQTQTFEKLIF